MKITTTIVFALAIMVSGFGQTISNKEIKGDLDDLLQSYANYNRFIGSVLISKNDTIIYQKSIGYSNFKEGKENTGTSIFRIASLTKSLTAVGIMKLVEDRKLTLEDPLSKYFPNFMPAYASKITIKHLLNNSFGIQGNIGRTDNRGFGLMPNKNPITLKALFTKFKTSKLNFKPGTAYEYNNFGYLLLANIIEKVSGTTYADFMKQSVFNPANMKNTTATPFADVNHGALPYLGLGMINFKEVGTTIHPSWLLGAANISSTTRDLYKFMQALDRGEIIKPKMVNKLYSLTLNMGVNNMKSGLGWVITEKKGEEWIYNNGLLPGYASVMGKLPLKNIKIIILSNATSVNPILDEFQGDASFVQGEITDKVISILLDKSVETLPIPTTKGKHIIDDNKKMSYQLDNKHAVILKRDGNMYQLEIVGAKRWSVFSYTFSKDVQKNDPTSKTALFFANAISTQKFDGLSDFGNKDMKAFLGTEKGLNQLKGMWNNFLQQAGKYHSFNIYKIAGDKVKNVSIRFHFETFDVGIVLSINNQYKIQGMFMDNEMKTSHITKVKLIPIGKNKFFINGHQNGGMQDLEVHITNTELELVDGNAKFIGKKSRK